MGIRLKRQTGAAAAPSRLEYGELAVNKAGGLYVGNESGSPKAVEPAFAKNNAFNKNFGNAAGTVCQGNDARLSDARPANGGLATGLKIWKSDWSGIDGVIQPIYANASKTYVSLTANNEANNAWPPISVSMLDGHRLSMTYNGNLWINW